MLAGEARQLQGRWTQGLNGVSIPLSALQTALEHLFYTRSWDGIAHGTRGCGLALDKNSKELCNTAPIVQQAVFKQLPEDHSDLIFTTALRRGAANSPVLWDGTEARGGGGNSAPRPRSSWRADLGFHPGRLASALCCRSLQSQV